MGSAYTASILEKYLRTNTLSQDELRQLDNIKNSKERSAQCAVFNIAKQAELANEHSVSTARLHASVFLKREAASLVSTVCD